MALIGDVRAVRARLGEISPVVVAAALVLASANMALRFARWQGYLRRIGAEVAVGTSFRVYLAGFALTVTPGRMGELVKSWLLRQQAGVPAARTTGAIFAEQVADLVAAVVLTAIGALIYDLAPTLAISGVIVVVVAVGLIWSQRLADLVIAGLVKLPPLRLHHDKLREINASLALLVRPRLLAWAAGLGAGAWLCEALAFALITNAFPGVAVPYGHAALIFAATTVAAALSFLPGGLGVSEAALTLLLVRSGHKIDAGTAVAATLVTRLCTLWFNVAIGFVALASLRRRPPANVAPP
jgi:uncharacterized membrane protein YbhN (UPF0104 family)